MSELGKPIRGHKKEMLRRAAEEQAKAYAKPARRRRLKKAGPGNDEGGSAAAAADPIDAEHAQAEHWVRGGLFKEGGKPGPGRPKGSLNKTSATMKEAILDVYRQMQVLHPGAGDHADFLDWAVHNRTEFYRIAARLAPLQIDTRNETVGLVIFKGLNG